jgi:hypothetical protein
VPDKLEPYLFTEQFNAEQTPVSAKLVSLGIVNGVVENAQEILDGDTRTFSEFNLDPGTSGNEQNHAQLILTSQKPLTLNGLSFFLDQFVALPTSIEITTFTDLSVGSSSKNILAKTSMQSTSVVFPKTTARKWVISLTYAQLLRITEIILHEEGKTVIRAQTLRFLAQPDHSYRIYFDADRSVPISATESANLFSDSDIVRLSAELTQKNHRYMAADSDEDGIPDTLDNCVSLANLDQKDVNKNGRGDACDDFDKDGVINSLDNCPNDPNANQVDVDADKIGDICDKEESRLTEKYAWLPWVGMSFAALVLIVLFAITARGMIKKQ